MPYPWPSLGSAFLFRREETAIPGTDVGWIRSPHYIQQTPLGSATDSITTVALGSMTRSFEVNLSPERYAIIAFLVNTKVLFTDWTRPIPDSRMAFVSSIEAQEFIARQDRRDSATQRTIRTKINLISQ